MARRDLGTVRRLAVRPMAGEIRRARRQMTDRRVTAERTFGTRADAAYHLAAYRRTRTAARTSTSVAGAETFGEYATTWLAQRADLRLYEGLLARHLLPHLATVPLARLTPATVRRLHAGRLQAGLGPSTVANAYRLLKTVLNTAVSELRSSPATRVCSAAPAANARRSASSREKPLSRPSRTRCRRLRRLGAGWPQFADPLGVSRQATRQRYRLCRGTAWAVRPPSRPGCSAPTEIPPVTRSSVGRTNGRTHASPAATHHATMDGSDRTVRLSWGCRDTLPAWMLTRGTRTNTKTAYGHSMLLLSPEQAAHALRLGSSRIYELMPASVRLGSLVGPGDKFTFEYDFGDGWEHQVVAEDVLPAAGRSRRSAWPGVEVDQILATVFDLSS